MRRTHPRVQEDDNAALAGQRRDVNVLAVLVLQRDLGQARAELQHATRGRGRLVGVDRLVLGGLVLVHLLVLGLGLGLGLLRLWLLGLGLLGLRLLGLGRRLGLGLVGLGLLGLGLLRLGGLLLRRWLGRLLLLPSAR